CNEAHQRQYPENRQSIEHSAGQKPSSGHHPQNHRIQIITPYSSLSGQMTVEQAVSKQASAGIKQNSAATPGVTALSRRFGLKHSLRRLTSIDFVGDGLCAIPPDDMSTDLRDEETPLDRD